jgi:hypothetical protein
VRGHLDTVRHLDRWRAVALASTSVPGSDELKQGDSERFPRRDWRLWERLRELGVDVTFADYGITGPRPDNDDPQYPPAPNLRYTTTAALLWWKGHKDEPPEGQRKLEYPDLCELLVKSGNFAGKTFSWGDGSIGSKAEGAPGPGRGQDWVAWATSHHVTVIRTDLDAAA